MSEDSLEKIQMIEDKSQEEDEASLVPLFILFLYLIICILFLTYPFNEDSKEEEYNSKKKAFHDGESFICKSSPLIYSTKYLVSPNEGWKINANSFTKGDLLIDMGACEKSSNTTKGEAK